MGQLKEVLNMTTLEKIIQDLSIMDEQQLDQVSALISDLNAPAQPIPCNRQNIREFIHQVRQKHPQRPIEEIDRALRADRDS